MKHKAQTFFWPFVLLHQWPYSRYTCFAYDDSNGVRVDKPTWEPTDTILYNVYYNNKRKKAYHIQFDARRPSSLI